jgi:uncharacterized protein YjbJ (UPF0337 family)
LWRLPAIPQAHWSSIMDHNRIEGTKHEVKGAIKETAGKVTGDKTQQLQGNLEKNAGKVQKEAGKMADHLRQEQKH